MSLSLLLSSTPLPPSLVSLVFPPVFFFLLPLPLFLLSTLPVIAPLPPGVFPLFPVFVLQAPTHTFHY